MASIANDPNGRRRLQFTDTIEGNHQGRREAVAPTLAQYAGDTADGT